MKRKNRRKRKREVEKRLGEMFSGKICRNDVRESKGRDWSKGSITETIKTQRENSPSGLFGRSCTGRTLKLESPDFSQGKLVIKADKILRFFSF